MLWVFWVLFFFLWEKWNNRKTSMWTSRSVRKELGRHAEAAIPFWLMLRWQDEPMHLLLGNGGIKSYLQPFKDSRCEQGTAPMILREPFTERISKHVKDPH